MLRGLGVLGGAAALALVAWWVNDAVRGESDFDAGVDLALARDAGVRDSSEDLNASTQQRFADGLELDAHADNGGAGGREAIQPQAALRGTVVDSAGVGLGDVLISWIPEKSESSGLATWREKDLSSVYGTTTTQGNFVLDLPEGSTDGVLWATKVGYLGASLVVSGSGANSVVSGVSRLVLNDAERLVVTTTRTDGKDLGSYQVVQLGAGDGLVSGSSNFPEVDPSHYFLRHLTASSNSSKGEVFLPVIPARTWIHAESGKLTSAHVESEAGVGVELALCPSFTLAVRLAEVDKVPSGAPARVSISAFQAEDSADAFVHLDHQGRAEVQVPLVACEFYEASLIGGGLAMEGQDFTPPQAGGRLEITFTGLPAEGVPVRFSSTDGEPVEGVQSSVSWTDASGVQRGSPPLSISDKAGLAILHSLPAGPFWLVYEHPGFVNHFEGPVYLADVQSAGLSIVMTPMGTVTGRVLFEGKPLEKYSLFAWDAELDPSNATTIDLTGLVDEQGSFSITLPAKPTQIMAWAPDHAQSLAQTVSIQGVGEIELELELPSAVQAEGIVLDELTRQPIPGAKVLAVISSGASAVATPARSFSTGISGEFLADGFSPLGPCVLSISAEGYADGRFVRDPAANSGKSLVDFGSLLMARESHIDFQFRSSNVMDWSGYTLDIDHATSTEPTVALESDGTAHFSGVKTSSPRFTLYSPSRLAIWVTRTSLEGFGPWSFQIDLEQGHALDVHVEDQELISSGALYASVECSDGIQSAHSRYGAVDPKTGLCHFDGLPLGTHSVFLLDSDYNRLACAAVTMIPGSVTHVTLAPGNDRLAITLVNTNGDPIPGATVTASGAGMPASSVFSATTNELGLADLGLVPFSSGRLTIETEEGGCMFGVPFSVAPNGNSTEIVWSADARLDLRAMDRGVPLAGAWMQVDLVDEPMDLLHTDLDSNGELKRTSLSEGNFRVSITSTWVWPQAQFPLAKTEDWLSGGLIQSSTGNLLTDASGNLTLTGLPNGKFTWSVSTLGLEGFADVPPLGTTSVLGLLE